MKRTAVIVVMVFLVATVAPAYAGGRYYGSNYGYDHPTETWGYGGKWEEKNSSPGDKWKWGVIGGLGLLAIGGGIFLANKVLGQRQQQVYQSTPPTYHPDKW